MKEEMMKVQGKWYKVEKIALGIESYIRYKWLRDRWMQTIELWRVELRYAGEAESNIWVGSETKFKSMQILMRRALCSKGLGRLWEILSFRHMKLKKGQQGNFGKTG